MALTAIPVGFSAGLFGIGGGLISVPVLFYIFGALGISNDYLMHLAVGTSFAIIVPTSISSVLTPQPTRRSINPAEKRTSMFLAIANICQSISYLE